MGLYRSDANAGGFVHADAEDLARKLQQGDGILWSGDPNLELRMATACAPKSMWFKELGRRVRKGEVLARRYEIVRHTEDGETVLIYHCRLEEFDAGRTLMEIAPMRLDSPGHVDTLAEIDKVNDQHERDNTSQMIDTMGEMMEHKLKLIHDLTQPRNVFRGMPGSRDDVKPGDGTTPPKVSVITDA